MTTINAANAMAHSPSTDSHHHTVSTENSAADQYINDHNPPPLLDHESNLQVLVKQISDHGPPEPTPSTSWTYTGSPLPDSAAANPLLKNRSKDRNQNYNDVDNGNIDINSDKGFGTILDQSVWNDNSESESQMNQQSQLQFTSILTTDGKFVDDTRNSAAESQLPIDNSEVELSLKIDSRSSQDEQDCDQREVELQLGLPSDSITEKVVGDAMLQYLIKSESDIESGQINKSQINSSGTGANSKNRDRTKSNTIVPDQTEERSNSRSISGETLSRVHSTTNENNTESPVVPTTIGIDSSSRARLMAANERRLNRLSSAGNLNKENRNSDGNSNAVTGGAESAADSNKSNAKNKKNSDSKKSNEKSSYKPQLTTRSLSAIPDEELASIRKRQKKSRMKRKGLFKRCMTCVFGQTEKDRIKEQRQILKDEQYLNDMVSLRSVVPNRGGRNNGLDDDGNELDHMNSSSVIVETVNIDLEENFDAVD